MPMRYADRADVLADLKLDEVDVADAAFIERVERLENGLADVFDQKTGTTFGDAPLPETRTVVGLHSDVLVLTDGVRSVAGVAVGGTWDGVAWTGETVLTPGAWALAYTDRDGVSYGLHRPDGEWGGPVRITGVWADQGAEAVPDDVREAMTFLTVEQFRTQSASPAGMIGPEGFAIPTRNPWNFTLVQEAINRHKVVRVVV